MSGLADATIFGITGFLGTVFFIVILFTNQIGLQFGEITRKKIYIVIGFSFVVGLICVPFGWFYTAPVYLPNIPESTDIPIYSADLGSQVSGSFILGSGYVGSEEYYRFNRGDPLIHGLTREQYPVSKSTVFLDENQTPYIRVRWLKDANTGNIIWSSYHYDFHLPWNAIVPKYGLN